MASINEVYPHPYRDVKMALDILMMGPRLVWIEDNQQYDHFKAWRKRVEMLTTGMALKKEPQDFICHCIKALSGETGHEHLEVAGLTVDNVARTKCLLDTLEGHCKPRSNEIVAATVYKQLVQGDLGLPEDIGKAKETSECMRNVSKFRISYHPWMSSR